jgi:hypothetical protein
MAVGLTPDKRNGAGDQAVQEGTAGSGHNLTSQMLGSDAFPRAALLAALHAVAVQVQCTSIQVHLEF